MIIYQWLLWIVDNTDCKIIYKKFFVDRNICLNLLPNNSTQPRRSYGVRRNVLNFQHLNFHAPFEPSRVWGERCKYYYVPGWSKYLTTRAWQWQTLRLWWGDVCDRTWTLTGVCASELWAACGPSERVTAPPPPTPTALLPTPYHHPTAHTIVVASDRSDYTSAATVTSCRH